MAHSCSPSRAGCTFDSRPARAGRTRTCVATRSISSRVPVPSPRRVAFEGAGGHAEVERVDHVGSGRGRRRWRRTSSRRWRGGRATRMPGRLVRSWWGARRRRSGRRALRRARRSRCVPPRLAVRRAPGGRKDLFARRFLRVELAGLRSSVRVRDRARLGSGLSRARKGCRRECFGALRLWPRGSRNRRVPAWRLALGLSGWRVGEPRERLSHALNQRSPVALAGGRVHESRPSCLSSSGSVR